MLLAADIGNSNITFGIFDDNILIKIFRLVSDTNLSEKEYSLLISDEINGFKISSSVIGSVVNGLGEKIKICIDNSCGINALIINSECNLGMKILTEHPENVGIDRIANIAGAKNYTNPLIVVDFGTATTFDIADKDGNFCGGIIMPGVKTQFQSLHSQTSKLPLIEPKTVEKVIGNNTENCILSGVIKGHACAIERLITECEKELGERATVISTGGFSDLISRHMTRKFDIINPNLTIEGLRNLYLLNEFAEK